MDRAKFKYIVNSTQAPDDQRLFVIRHDFSGGINTRQHASNLGDNQAEDLSNWDIGVMGEMRKRSGLSLVEDVGTTTGTGAFGFEPDGGTPELLITHSTKLEGWVGSGSFVEHKTNFTTGLLTTMFKAGESGEGDVVFVGNGTDNWFRMNQSHTMQDLGNTAGTGSDSPPKSTVGTYYRNRVWVLKSNLLYWSDAFPADYSSAFDTVSNNFRIPVGTERAILGLRDTGLVVIGADQVWGINPSATPTATDLPEKILDIGCVCGNTVAQVGDDIYFLAKDGVRAVFRSQQDKLQLGVSYPLSYPLKDEYNTISWGYISKANAVYWDNKYFLSLPVNSSSYNNQVWVYYPAQQAWTIFDDWNIAAFSKITISGEERLYAIDSTDAKIYRVLDSTTDNSTAVSATFIGKEENFGQPLVEKNGGEIEIEADVAGSGDSLSVSVSLDGQSFQSLGTVDLTSSTAPTLPVALPFSLSDSYIVRKKFHLDTLGSFRTIQIKFTNTDTNTDPIVVYGYNIITFAEEYENE